jgi:uncharacterized protein YjiS (DUF1127 family)
MATHISKEQLGLMLPGTMNHYFQDEPLHLEALRPGLFSRLAAIVAGIFARRAVIQEIAGMTDAQLADIGITRAEAPMVFNTGFAAQREHERTVMVLQTGRLAGF